MRASDRSLPTARSKRSFQYLLLVIGFSNLGDGISLVAFPLLSARYGVSPMEIGLIVFARMSPWLIFSLPAGLIIDRLSPKRIIFWVNIGRFLIATILAVLISTETINVPILVAVAALIGCLEVLSDNSAQSLVPMVVDKQQLTTALARQQTIELVVNRFIGIPIGGFMMAQQEEAAFVSIAIAYIAAAFLVTSLCVRTERISEDDQSGEKTSFWKELFAGARYIWRHSVLRVLAFNTGFSNFATQAVEAVFVLFITQALKVPGWAFGIILSMEAIGGIVGSLIVVKLKDNYGEANILRLVIFTLPFIIIFTPLFLNPWIVAGMYFLLGISNALWGAIAVSYRQEIVPGVLMGRANAFYRLIAWGTLPLGSLVGGWSAGTFGYVVNYVLVGIFLMGAWVTLPILSTRRLEAARKMATVQA